MNSTKEAQLEQFIEWAKLSFQRVESGGPGRDILAKLDHSAVKEVLEEALWVPYHLGRNRDYGDYQMAAQYALTITTGTSTRSDRAERVQALLFATHIARQEAQLQNQMFEAGESEIVWATIAALAEYLDLNSDVAKAIALGYNTMDDWERHQREKDDPGLVPDTAPLVETAKGLFRCRIRETNASDLTCILNGTLDDAPEYVRPLVDRLKEHFPDAPPWTMKFIFAGLLVSACLDGNLGCSSTFSYKEDDE